MFIISAYHDTCIYHVSDSDSDHVSSLYVVYVFSIINVCDWSVDTISQWRVHLKDIELNAGCEMGLNYLYQAVELKVIPNENQWFGSGDAVIRWSGDMPHGDLSKLLQLAIKKLVALQMNSLHEIYFSKQIGMSACAHFVCLTCGD